MPHTENGKMTKKDNQQNIAKSAAIVSAIFRYPVKALGGQQLPSAQVRAGVGLAFDRRWMLAHSNNVSSLFDDDADIWRPWEFCTTLKKTADCARLDSRVEELADGGCILTIAANNGESQSVKMNAAGEGDCRQLNLWLRELLNEPRICLLPCPRPAWDERDMPLTIINIATVSEVAAQLGEDITPARFRANIIINDAAPWSEHKSKQLTIGDRVFRTLGGVPRCPAMQVNPRTAMRDADVAALLRRHYRHNRLGVYADAPGAGEIAEGMAVHL